MNYRRGIKRLLILINIVLFLPGLAFGFWSSDADLFLYYWLFILFFITPFIWLTYAVWPYLRKWLCRGFYD